MLTLTEEAKEAKRQYYREYNRKYRKRMTPEQKARQKEYKRAWDKAHPDKVKEAQIRFWNRQAERLKLKASGD